MHSVESAGHSVCQGTHVRLSGRLPRQRVEGFLYTSTIMTLFAHVSMGLYSQMKILFFVSRSHWITKKNEKLRSDLRG